MEQKSVLVYDIETDSLDVNATKIKFFGAYSYMSNEYYLLKYDDDKKQIRELIANHKILVGFNNKNFDNIIISNNYNEDNLFEYKIIIDLYEISAPKSSGDYGKNNKNKLIQMGHKLKRFSLKSISIALNLDDNSKGDIDYNIFKKNSWTKEELNEIYVYLKQDVNITKKLLEWYDNQFEPLKKFLTSKQQNNFDYIRISLASLAYMIICNKTGMKMEWGDIDCNRDSYAGGHHINASCSIVKGNIIEIDFTSAYPHALMMGNLYSMIDESEEGWGSNDIFKLSGKYDNKNQGKIELAIKDIFLERLKAKKAKDKERNLSYKTIINSIYGITASPIFKSIYNRNTASDCTLIVRTWMKRLASELEQHDFECLYGFTDSIFVKVPDEINEFEFWKCVLKFVEDTKKLMPFPMNTFGLEVEERIKMIWFIAKNCYLFVTQDNKIKYKSTLLNTNTPAAVLELFNKYMTPKIIEGLDINFTKEEIETEIINILKVKPELAAVEYRVTELEHYKVKSSLHYQISERYGSGRHFLIPNMAKIGIGRGLHKINNPAVRHCTITEFREKNLNTSDIDISNLIKHLKPFFDKRYIQKNLEGFTNEKKMRTMRKTI